MMGSKFQMDISCPFESQRDTFVRLDAIIGTLAQMDISCPVGYHNTDISTVVCLSPNGYLLSGWSLYNKGT